MFRTTFLTILILFYQEASPNNLNVGFLFNRASGLSTEPSFKIEQSNDIIENWNKLYFGIELNKGIYTINHNQIGFGLRIDYLPLSSIQKLSISSIQSLDIKLSIYQFEPAIYIERNINSIFKFKFGGSILFNRYEMKSSYLPTNLGFITNQTETDKQENRAGCIFGEVKYKLSKKISIPFGIKYSIKKQEIKSMRAQKDINPNDPINDPNTYGFIKIDQIIPYLSICYQIL
jgi:hypothetical protein